MMIWVLVLFLHLIIPAVYKPVQWGSGSLSCSFTPLFLLCLGLYNEDLGPCPAPSPHCSCCVRSSTMRIWVLVLLLHLIVPVVLGQVQWGSGSLFCSFTSASSCSPMPVTHMSTIHTKEFLISNTNHNLNSVTGKFIFWSRKLKPSLEVPAK